MRATMLNLLKKRNKTLKPTLQMANVFDDEIRELYKKNEYSLTLDSIYSFAESDLYKKIRKRLEKNKLALLSPFCQVLLIHLTMIMKPKKVLEIGTYQGGTAYNIASALNENKKGYLTTIDPFEKFNKAQQNFKQFPQEIKDRIDFQIISSPDYFNVLTFKEFQYELIFIDGNHNYEFAYFDLTNAAKFVPPGGLIVLDNVDQIGPRFATKKFLAENPNWVDFMGVINKEVPENHSPLDYYMSSNQEITSDDNLFYILQAPSDYRVTDFPNTVGPENLKRKSDPHLKVRCKNEIKGKLYLLVYVRAFFSEGLPQEMRLHKSVAINSNINKEYSIPIVNESTKRSLRDGADNYTIEFSYSFESENKDESLVLTSPLKITYED